VTVTASDGELDDAETVTIQVESGNTPPVIELGDVLVNVGQGETVTISLNPVVSDADGDNVQVSYSGWMSSSSRDVTIADAGDYQVTVSANDGTTAAQKTITVSINAKPSFDFG
jgi:hypothetical protein